MNRKTETTRRDFLRISGSAVAASTLADVVIPRVHAAESHVLKLGLIGCGGRGTGAVSEALTADPGTKLWAVADAFADRIERPLKALTPKFKERIEVAPERRFVGLQCYRPLIECCDVVVIACPPRFHAEYALAAVKAKKHVFVEKTSGVDSAGVHKMLEADELSGRNGTAILNGFVYRYHRGRREAVQRMQGGEIGDIVAVQCDYIRTTYQQSEHKPEWSELEYQLRYWNWFSWLSGDDVSKSLSHNLDSALWVFGDVMPEAAYGVGGRSTHFDDPKMGTCFDHHALVYEFADGRCIYGFGRVADGCYNSNKDVYHGTKGRCYFKMFQPPYFTDLKGNVTWRADAEPREMPPRVRAHTEFLQSIRAGKPIHHGKTVATSTMACVLGQLATYTGQRMTWKEAFDSRFEYPPHVPLTELTLESEPPVKPGPDGLYPVPIPGRTKLVKNELKTM